MSDIFSYIGGTPFACQAFDPGRLVDLVSHRRLQLSGGQQSSQDELIQPHCGRALYAARARHLALEIPLLCLTARQYEQIRTARLDIADICSSWNQMYQLPVDYFLVDDGRLSVSCGLVPQTIFIGPAAFLDRDTLLEAIVHENAHIWLDLLREIADLQDPSDQALYTLPSGTQGKTLTGVLLAAHFATSAHAYWSRKPTRPRRVARLKTLHQYASDCLDAVKDAPGLTEVGSLVWRDLWNYTKAAYA
ncbi:MAG: hypothetical protein JWP59_415 [Massilia sp.]|nr:hypothetical protein [Massilia sp.]